MDVPSLFYHLFSSAKTYFQYVCWEGLEAVTSQLKRAHSGYYFKYFSPLKETRALRRNGWFQDGRQGEPKMRLDGFATPEHKICLGHTRGRRGTQGPAWKGTCWPKGQSEYQNTVTTNQYLLNKIRIHEYVPTYIHKEKRKISSLPTPSKQCTTSDNVSKSPWWHLQSSFRGRINDSC